MTEKVSEAVEAGAFFQIYEAIEVSSCNGRLNFYYS